MITVRINKDRFWLCEDEYLVPISTIRPSLWNRPVQRLNRLLAAGNRVRGDVLV